jgi:hypothetical protein
VRATWTLPDAGLTFTETGVGVAVGSGVGVGPPADPLPEPPQPAARMSKKAMELQEITLRTEGSFRVLKNVVF